MKALYLLPLAFLTGCLGYSPTYIPAGNRITASSSPQQDAAIAKRINRHRVLSDPYVDTVIKQYILYQMEKENESGRPRTPTEKLRFRLLKAQVERAEKE